MLAGPPFRRLVRFVQLHVELTKARLSSLVVVTAGGGYVLAAGIEDSARLLWTLLGTFLASAGAMALNQVWEVARDARMHRTATRPLVTGALPRWYGLAFGLLCSSVGVLLLAWKSHPLAALLGLLVIALYVLVYTPLKAKSPFCTLVGAVCGAIPPLMGWAGATGSLAPGAWILAFLLFFWQIPHFLSLAWLYREDYRRGGFRMLPEVDPEGRLTGRFSFLYALATAGSALSLALLRLAGAYFTAGAILLGGTLVFFAWRLAAAPSDRTARALFRTTLLYLPLVVVLSAVDRRGEVKSSQVAEAPAPPAAALIWVRER
ncbi:MAG: protoheme IX farnesyltransferase [Thermoanaerobaculum sp.]|nr:MAG: protoheme IX farnesyltransferase [Thermoanaerobaculum sp.]